MRSNSNNVSMAWIYIFFILLVILQFCWPVGLASWHAAVKLIDLVMIKMKQARASKAKGHRERNPIIESQAKSKVEIHR